MKIIFILLFMGSFLNADLLSDRMQSKSNELCYSISIEDETNNGSLPPSVFIGTLGASSLRSTKKIERDVALTCDDWENDPYVNKDTEIRKIVAENSCYIETWNTTYVDSDGITVQIPHWRRLIQTSVYDVTCNVGCEIPKDSYSNNYDFTRSISEAECTVNTLNSLVQQEDPNSNIIIVDTEYLECSISSRLTGCYYLTGYAENNETNETNLTTPSDMNLTPVTNELKKVDDSIKNMNNELGNKLGSIESAISNLKNQLKSDAESAYRQRARMIHEMNATANASIENMIINRESNRTLHGIEDFLKADVNQSDIDEATDKVISDINSTIASMSNSLNGIVSSYTGFTMSFSGTGSHIFSAEVFGSVITLDLSMFELLRPTFDILWYLLLAWLNFRIYFLVIRDLLRKV